MNKLKILMIVLVFISPKLFALQSKTWEDGIPLNFAISEQELSHIQVEHDRISAVKSATENFVLERDEEQGHLFLRPHSKTELVQLFIITEGGKTIALRLQPTNIPAESIRIKTDAVEEPPIVPKTLAKTEPDLLIELIEALQSQKILEGYSAFSPAPSLSVSDRGLELIPLRTLQNAHWQGTVLRVHNPKRRSIVLKEQDFAALGVRAIAIADKNLVSKHSTVVYLVKEL